MPSRVRARRLAVMPRTLVVDDDPIAQAALVSTLEELGHEVRAVSTASAALCAAGARQLDLVLFDLGLPEIDGMAALRKLRNRSAVPVIVSTARAAEDWLLAAFDAGADDYIVKPYSRRHLAARVNALLRRSGRRPVTAQNDEEVLMVGDDLKVDLATRTARLCGAPLSLSRREFDLLAYLATKQGIVVTRRELVRKVWEQPHTADTTIAAHTSWLRRKLGETASAPRYLHTVRGVGLKLVAP
ncbi:DNA-binding response regulator, OmpR family, contains REC and winged-helix (wHTH) domain [Lentzea waywayandensis]|uniref:DNA-binding response regulator, OmpR family, contains REC and winged-helix (WHTH) domain n=2 Tax=Lentzea waywayandensis TaxID=84724 RepID=A0A1I6FJH5_9PSEU|nr:DNA-binding response regulator, OmpR family, contains REC and winged-helix (wHTH) domain [Lentzea waywayandensis]